MRKIIAMFEIDDEQAERYCKENGYEGVSPDELFESEMGFAEGGIALKNWQELGDAHEGYWNTAFAEGKPASKAVEALTIPPKDRLLKERDEQLRALWEEFQNVPRTNANDRFAHITEDFYFWKAGTQVAEILDWFEVRHSYGVQKLLYPNTPTTQEEEDEEEIRFAIEDMDDKDISEFYGITREKMMNLVPEMARRMRQYIDESEDWSFKRDRAIEHVAEDYKDGKYRD